MNMINITNEQRYTIVNILRKYGTPFYKTVELNITTISNKFRYISVSYPDDESAKTKLPIAYKVFDDNHCKYDVEIRIRTSLLDVVIETLPQKVFDYIYTQLVNNYPLCS